MSPSLKHKNNSKLFQLIADEAIMGYLAFSVANYKCVYANRLAKQLIDFNINLEESPSEEDSFEFDLYLKDIFPNIDTEKAKERGFTALNFNLLLHEGLYQGVLVRKKNNQQFIANLGVKKLEIDNEEHLLLMIQDITIQSKLQREVLAKQNEIKAAYEELVHQNVQLKALDKAKDRFIALTTHELRTPASAMLATADVLKNKLYSTEEELTQFVDMIYDQGLHLLELINDILDFSKIQAGKMDYYVEELSIHKVLAEEIASVQNISHANNVSVSYDSKQEPRLCYFDELRIRQVIRNILSNAIKYNTQNGKVQVWSEESEDFITVFIKDTGVGIPLEHKSKVFDEFETLGKVAQHHEGTGLGMPISRQLIHSMGGEIDFESTLGVGTTFWFKIPKHKVLKEEVYRSRPNAMGDLAAS